MFISFDQVNFIVVIDKDINWEDVKQFKFFDVGNSKIKVIFMIRRFNNVFFVCFCFVIVNNIVVSFFVELGVFNLYFQKDFFDIKD